MGADKTLVLLLLVFGSGCASIGEVKQADRDPDFRFDGHWIARPETTRNRQIHRNWEFTCGQFDVPVALRIASSRVTVLLDDNFAPPLNKAFISTKGNFKTTLPTGIKRDTTSTSDVIHSDVDVRLIVEGSLIADGQGTGHVTIGYAVANYQGCTTELIFTKE